MNADKKLTSFLNVNKQSRIMKGGPTLEAMASLYLIASYEANIPSVSGKQLCLSHLETSTGRSENLNLHRPLSKEHFIPGERDSVTINMLIKMLTLAWMSHSKPSERIPCEVYLLVGIAFAGFSKKKNYIYLGKFPFKWSRICPTFIRPVISECR